MNKRRIARRAVIGILASIELLIASVGGYALYTRAGAPSFARGGAFGVPDPALTRGGPIVTSSRRAASKPAGSRARHTTPTRTSHVVAGSRPVAGVTLPRAGTYRFTGSGHEQIEFAGGSPCSWDVTDVTTVVKHTADGEVFDWTYAPQRQQRTISQFRSNGIYTSFVGAAVTCVVRKTDNETYDPAALRIQLPLVVGSKWHRTAHSANRDEDVNAAVAAHRAFVVPAGTFDAYEIKFDVAISGGQTGSFHTTMWFAPALGIEVQAHATTDVVQSSAHFTSDITFALASLPA